MSHITTLGLFIAPQADLSFQNIKIFKHQETDIEVDWKISAVCNSERRRFNLTKSHHDRQAFVGGHEAVGVMPLSGGNQACFVLLPHSNCVTRNELDKCPACLNNSENLCSRMRHAGLDENTPSGFTHKMIVPESQLYEVTNIDVHFAVFLEPLACVIHSWDKVSFDYKTGKNVINIIGGGPIGCLHALLLNKVNSQNRINIFENNVKRLNTLKTIFAAYKNISIHNNYIDELADVSVMAASNSSAYECSCNLTKENGSVLLFSGFDDIDFQDDNFLPEIIHRHEFIHYAKNRIFIGSSGYKREDIKRSEKFLTDFKELKSLITGKVYGLDSSEIELPDGTKCSYNQPVLIEDIKGRLYEHIKIQYYNNSNPITESF